MVTRVAPPWTEKLSSTKYPGPDQACCFLCHFPHLDFSSSFFLPDPWVFSAVIPSQEQG